jgi:outer membrane lipase/esterase
MNLMQPRARRGWRPALLAGLCAAAVLSACGGSAPIKEFKAEQLDVFGDEASVLTADGRKYSVNVLDDNGAIDCATQPIWVQRVAAVYDLVFAECNPNAATETRAILHAAPGAMAADLPAQVDAAIAAGFPKHALATVLVGAHDVWALYAQYPGRTEDDLAGEARSRGQLIGRQVNRLIQAGVRVLLATVPDQGLTPRALAERDAYTDTNRAKLLTRLTADLNGALRLEMSNDGREVGLVLADEMLQAMAKSPGSFGISEAEIPACTVALPDCTSATLVEDATSASYLWADDLQFAYGGQTRLGNLAVGRAKGNPF